jgi:hypothetical protein
LSERPVFAKATPRQAPLGQIQSSAKGGKTDHFIVAKADNKQIRSYSKQAKM